MDVERGGKFATPCTFSRKDGAWESAFPKDPYVFTFSPSGLTVDQVSFLPDLFIVIISLTMQRALDAMGFLLCRQLPPPSYNKGALCSCL